MNMIVDTNALSAFADRDQNVRECLLSGSGPYLPVIVVGEYRFGLLSSRERDKRLGWLEALIREWEILEISEKTAVHYAELRRQLKEAATPIPSNDVWIAALAREHRLPVLTNDPHFDLVNGVERMSF
jgi:tRNA(fMet)-specific endonuclease VapC